MRRRRNGGGKGGKKKKSRDQLCVNMELKRETLRPRLYAKKESGKCLLCYSFFWHSCPTFPFFFFVLDGRSVLPTFQSLVHRPFIPPCQKNIRICPFELFRSLRFEEREKRKMPHTHTSTWVCPFWTGPKKAFSLGATTCAARVEESE